MRKALLGLAALVTATASQAAVVFNFNSAPGNIGNSHTYTVSGLSITANGYTNFNFGANTGTAGALFGKNGGGDENGLGLVSDPTGDDEIWYAGDGFNTIPAIIIDVSAILANVSGGQFEMGSTTAHEQWILGGYNGSSWAGLLTGTTEGSFINLPGWGTYTKYGFISGGTVVEEQRSSGNVLLTALSFTPVPEPGTWAMMILGFAGMGIALRRKPVRTAIA